MKSAKIAIVPAISRLNCDFSLKTRDLLHIRPLPARFLRPFLWGVRKTSVQRARSSAVEHFVDIEGVTGSIPVVPTILYTWATPRPGFEGEGHEGQKLASLA